MKNKKVMSALLIVSMICSPVTASATNEGLTYVDQNEVFVKATGTGSYEIISTNISSKIADNQLLSEGEDIFSISQVKDDIYKVNNSSKIADNEKLLKVNNTTFQKVTEINLGTISENNIEDKIKKNNVTEEIANDLRSAAQLSATQDSIIEGVLYSASSFTYYVGYNGYNYRNQLLSLKQVTPYNTVKSGADLGSVANSSIQTIAESIIGGASGTYVGSIFTLRDLFSSVFTVFPASTGDWWQVSLNELKDKKYTAIDYLCDGTYSVKAISEKGSGYFSHLIYDCSEGSKTTRNSNPKGYTSSYYNNLDYKAYLHGFPSDTPYIEGVTSWRINTFYSYRSIS